MIVARRAALAMLLGSVAAAGAADWPQFRGPGGLGVSLDTAVPQRWGLNENIVWKRDPGAGASTPVVFGQRLYLTSYSGYGTPGNRGSMDQLKRHVLCLDCDTGKTIWEKEVESKLPEQPRIREDHGYASSSVAVDAERVYAFFGKSGVFAFDHAGRQLWHADVGSGLNGWGSAASPVVVGELLVVNASVESGALVALDRKTGREVWRAGGIRESWNTPIVVTPPGGQPELAVAVLGKVLGFDPATGRPLWSCATDIGWYMVPSLVADPSGVVYCVGGRNGGGALAVRAGGRGDVTATHRLWTLKKGTNVPSPIYHAGHLYWVNDATGVAFCAEAKTGRVVYEERLGRGTQVYASPVLAGGKLYYTDRVGQTYVLPVGPRFQSPVVNELRDRGVFNASPAVANGRLYLRSDRMLYCIGTR